MITRGVQVCRLLGVLLAVAACRLPDEGWPRGYAIVEGTVSLRDGTPWIGEVRLRYGGHLTTVMTSASGSYQVALAPPFPEGVPDTALMLRADPLYPGEVSFLDSTTVLFATSPALQRAYRFDIREQ